MTEDTSNKNKKTSDLTKKAEPKVDEIKPESNLSSDNSAQDENLVGSLSIPTEDSNNVQLFEFGGVNLMALDDIANILDVTSTLGAGYKSIQSTSTSSDSTDALSKISAARQAVVVNTDINEYDYAATLAASIRTVEKKITSDVLPVMKSCCQALETYSKAAWGVKFRDKWNATSAGVNDPFFTENFQNLWRNSLAEELIVKIGTVTKASGVWPATITKIHTVADVKAATTGILPNSPSYAAGVLTATGSATALAAQDGITLSAGDRLLVKNQVAQEQNGIYIVTSIGSSTAYWMLKRATDADAASASEVSFGMATYVSGGSTNINKRYYMSNASFTTIGASGATGNQPFTETKLSTISLNENLEIRVTGNGSAATTDAIVATLVVQKADLTTSLQTVTIPVGTAVGARFAIGASTIKGSTISSVSIASDNGVDGDLLEIWVKSAS